jgi:hypothetical protein
MLASDHFRMKTESTQQGILFSFNGFISEAILFALGDALKKKMSADETSLTTMRRVFSVFVEQAQNIIRYSAETLAQGGPGTPHMGSGLLTVGAQGEHFFVVCGNIMLKKDAEALLARLEQIRGLDAAGIKAFYRERIQEEDEPASKGASLGLIEIARRASEPIEYDFLDIDADTTFYCMKVLI